MLEVCPLSAAFSPRTRRNIEAFLGWLFSSRYGFLLGLSMLGGIFFGIFVGYGSAFALWTAGLSLGAGVIISVILAATAFIFSLIFSGRRKGEPVLELQERTHSE
ncbi:hypothetical protein [Donghicola sp. XS_ASV15]|uniref:hypothetical protein n=1 Tax=Donghicola sp. XS_ASV15 TaxID=3241295 RepID=UPI00351579BB